MMFRGGGCCGGHSHGGHDHGGQGHMGQNGDNRHFGSGSDYNQIETAIDPVCGMPVNPSTAIMQKVDGNIYYFCSESCRSSFVRKHQGL